MILPILLVVLGIVLAALGNGRGILPELALVCFFAAGVFALILII